MSFNRIAIYGHRGWASSAITNALIASRAPVRVLYRPGSDASGLPPSVPKVEVDLDNQKQLIAALQDIDIVISLAGREAVSKQHAFIKAIPSTNVKLFVPSDLGFRNYSESALRVPVLKAKFEVEEAAKEAKIPTTLVYVGSFAESTLSIGILGVDVPGNRIIFSGDSANQQANICTRNYVAAAYASIFASTPLDQLQDRAIGLSELRATGKEIAAVLKKKHGAEPQIFRHSPEKIENELESAIKSGSPLALSWYCRKAWGEGIIVKGVSDLWEVEGYKKATLEDLLLEGKLEPYRDVGPQIAKVFDSIFH
ncbi:NmrA-like family protein [Daldinia vernicosa]|uniref:NmrA-like family protein n=1 Tax=Daldinia vernicosa TaxID=114800 RepID=UPI0020079769|nr:NmrA-like family protein [Daldinia vernicosa]KAI0849110.1 NmrA-like family protein [Daldinia vernicosa]